MNRLDEIIQRHKAAGEKPWFAIKASEDKDLKHEYPGGAHYVSALTAKELSEPSTVYADCKIWTDEGLTSLEIANFIANAKQDISYLLSFLEGLAFHKEELIKMIFKLIPRLNQRRQREAIEEELAKLSYVQKDGSNHENIS